MTKSISIVRWLLAPVMVLFLTAAAHAAAPGITGQSFTLTARTAFLNQPDGNAVYSWGYGCTTPGTGFTFAPSAALMPGSTCPDMQVPGPTLIVTEGQTITVTLANGLPTAAGNTSILFPDFQVTATGGVAGLLTREAQQCPTSAACTTNTVTYSFTASTPGTHAYYSGTQGDLQIEMGLYGAIIVLPSSVPGACSSVVTSFYEQPTAAPGGVVEHDFRLAKAAYDHAKTCYDREYLFQWAEMDTNIHRQALAQVADPIRIARCATGAATPGCSLEVSTEPYHPSYFLINGRSMPDLMDANFAVEYPHQPYNGNPHMHPGEQVLIRTIGQGRWQHPFHEHGNHVRILARDGNLILSSSNVNDLAGILMFNTDTTPGQAFDGIFYWSGRGLNWDPYAHNPASTDPLAKLPCNPDANGYYTSNSGAPLNAANYFEWCQDHNKPLEVAPVGDVAGGGPATLPNPQIFSNGPWYGGTPYLGPNATTRSAGPTDNLQPSNVQANPANERGFAFMWHSHNEREITTNNVFPGGMLMMMLVDSREFVIDESM
jgi:FtsP/CotA-like multicopper oxidase with cupredoxin domain